MNIDDVLEEVRRSTEIDAWKIALTPSHDAGLYASKAGGIPYWDMSRDYPRDSEGRALCLLAQINLADLGNNDCFAPSGMLQFFIGTDELMGMDFDTYDSGKGSRIIYHDELRAVSVDDVLSLNIPLTTNRDIISPVFGELAMTFTRRKVSMSPMDYRFNDIVSAAAQRMGVEIPNGLQALIGDERYWELCGGTGGHWLLGYPHFTQEDPRYMGQYSAYTRMLLQLDSEGAGIMWGDAGVGAFYLTDDAFRDRDYSKFLYNWDCA